MSISPATDLLPAAAAGPSRGSSSRMHFVVFLTFAEAAALYPLQRPQHRQAVPSPERSECHFCRALLSTVSLLSRVPPAPVVAAHSSYYLCGILAFSFYPFSYLVNNLIPSEQFFILNSLCWESLMWFLSPETILRIVYRLSTPLPNNGSFIRAGILPFCFAELF